MHCCCTANIQINENPWSFGKKNEKKQWAWAKREADHCPVSKSHLAFFWAVGSGSIAMTKDALTVLIATVDKITFLNTIQMGEQCAFVYL